MIGFDFKGNESKYLLINFCCTGHRINFFSYQLINYLLINFCCIGHVFHICVCFKFSKQFQESLNLNLSRFGISKPNPKGMFMRMVGYFFFQYWFWTVVRILFLVTWEQCLGMEKCLTLSKFLLLFRALDILGSFYVWHN